MNISFLTFASSDWIKSPVRYKKDLSIIKETNNFFDKTFIWNEKDLNIDYQNRFSKYYQDHGFAYFSWKPYSIRLALSYLNDGDFLLYLDSGCVLPMNNIESFLSEIKNSCEDIIKNKSFVGLTTYIDKNPNIKIPNICIIKMEILKKFGYEENEELLLKYPHYQAGLMLIQKNENTIKFLSDWYDFFTENYETCIRGEYTDKCGQYQYFLHNGSDQAVLQCLLFKHKYAIYNMNWMYNYNLIQHRMG